MLTNFLITFLDALNKKVYSQGAARQRNSAMYSANDSFTAWFLPLKSMAVG